MQNAIAIHGGWAGVHLGDDAILFQTLREVHRLRPDSTKILFCSTPEVTRNRLIAEGFDLDSLHIRIVPALRNYIRPYAQRVVSSKNLWERLTGRLAYLNMIWRVTRSAINGSPRPPRGCTKEEWNDLLHGLSSCRVMVLTGGGYVLSDLRLPWLYPTLALIKVCKKRGIPVIVTGQSLGPFEPERDRRIAARFFRHVQIFGVRESTSAQTLLSLGVPASKIVQECDCVLAWPDDSLGSKATTLPKLPDRFVSFSLQPREHRTMEEDARITRAALKELPDASVVFHPHTPEDHDYQLALAKSIGEEFSTRIVVLDADLPVSVHYHIHRRSLCGIGTRFHFSVLSFAANRPSIAIGRKQKIVGLYEQFDSEGMCLEDEAVDDLIEKLMAALKSQMRNYEELALQRAEQLDAICALSHSAMQKGLAELIP